MISFYPGPSKVHSSIPKYVRDAYKEGVLSINHRSPEFKTIFSKATALLKEKLSIPEDYLICFTSSATECWEIIAQSLITHKSFHLYNGSFGEKWLEYTKKLKPESSGFRFPLEELPQLNNLQIADQTEIICLTHNETSNGTCLTNDFIAECQAHFPEKLIAVDATSSMAGVQIEIKNADIWYASVQKCFGLPAGLAVMVCSPKAVKKAIQIGESQHYNSLKSIIGQTENGQTTHTPNVLNIYLLMRVMEKTPSIQVVSKMIERRYQWWSKILEGFPVINYLVKNEQVRSKTVITLQASPELVQNIKEKAKEGGILLGNGYGEYKAQTFRIANFPAISDKEISILKFFLEKHFQELT